MTARPADPVCGSKSTSEYATTQLIRVLPSSEGFPNRPPNSAPLTLPPIGKNKSYENVSGATRGNFGNVFKWKMGFLEGPQKPTFPSSKEASDKLPSVLADVHAVNRYNPWRCPCGKCEGSNLKPDMLGATWTSHASFLVTAGGYTVLTDPVWADRASPIQCAGPKRMVPPPIALDDLPYVDVVTISHNHYDHLCTETVKHLIKFNHELAAKRAGASNPKSHPIFVVPMGMKTRWFVPLSESLAELDLNKVVELMWWDSADVSNAVSSNRSSAGNATTNLPPLLITAVPVQHWTLRNGFDNNRELWCGFVCDVKAAVPFKFFHSGDTGFHKPLFEEIGNECGPFDFAMIPIGAYEPRFIMRQQHIDPFQAAEIHKDLKSKNSAGMHWGTFILTDEPVDEPPKALAVAMAEQYHAIPGTESGENDSNALKLKTLRKGNFLAGKLDVRSENDCLPYFDCAAPFRALRHGETWAIVKN